MSNVITKTAKKTVKKTGKKVIKGSVNYAKGYIVKGIVCWALAALVALPNAFGIEVPAAISGYDTIAVAAFIIAGFICFGRKLTVGRAIALIRTFFK